MPNPKTAILIRVDEDLRAEIDDYLKTCAALGMTGTRASVVLGATRRGLKELREELAKRRR